MEKTLGKIIGAVFGLALIVIAIVRPAFAWNWDMVTSIRSTVGDLLTSVFLIVIGFVIAVTSVLFGKR